MKNCPKCHTVYTDDTLKFCLIDGSRLSEASSVEAPDESSRSSQTEDTEPEPTQILYPDFKTTVSNLPIEETASSTTEESLPFATEETVSSVTEEETVLSAKEPSKKESSKTISSLPITEPSSPRRKYQPSVPPGADESNQLDLPPGYKFDIGTAETSRPETGRNGKYLLIALPVLLLAAIGGWMIFGGRTGSPAIENNTATTNQNAPENTTVTANNNSAPDNTANTGNMKTGPNNISATPANTDKMNLTGTWKGISGVTPATLVVKDNGDNTYSGTKIQKTWLVALTITVNPDTRAITIRETSLIKGNSSEYSLGVNTGKISADGKNMSGTGKDSFNTSYPWKFSR